LKAKARALEAEKTALKNQTARVEEREDEAETVLAVAEGVASGVFVLDTVGHEPALIEAPKAREASPSSPTLEALRKRSPRGFVRASGVFGRAWHRLFGQARTTAIAEAAVGVADEMKQVAEADEVIAKAAAYLPQQTRAIVAKIRQTIPAIMRRLEHWTKPSSDGQTQAETDPNEPSRE
jgi:predicted nucleic acid-binding Zn ribbon protein